MDLTPRNSFNCRLAGRYWQVPTDLPKATHYNTPIGTKFCDTLGFMCHPQTYPNMHGGNYRNIDHESMLYNLDYYNPLEGACPQTQKLSDVLIDTHFQNVHRCQTTPKLWNNTTKLYKYGTPPNFARRSYC